MPGVAKRAPWPSDVLINSIGYELGAVKEGEPVFTGAKQQDLASVVPTDFGPSALNPVYERTQIYDDLSQGYGQRLQSASRTRGYRYLIGADLRYYYALGVDASVSRQIVLGPLITTLTPATVDSVNGITTFFEILGNLFALNGRYCLSRTNDTTWPVAKDYGVGKVARDAVVFASNAAGVASKAYIAMGDTEPIWNTDGGSWTQSAEALYSRAWGVVGREFWRATPSTVNTISKCDIDADPFVLANWSNANSFTIGDKTTAIQRLAVSASQGLLILKTDGIYTLDTAGFDHNLYPYLKGAADADNGKFFAPWLNDVYVAYRDGTFRINESYQIEEIGPERLTDNASPVKGRITAMAAHDTFNLYAGLYNDDTGNCYLMKFGGWDSPQDAAATRLDVWHGSISQAFTGKKITAMYRASTGNYGASAGHSRMFIGFSDGSLAWFQLPCTPNPAACSSYSFATTPAGQLFLPEATMGFISDLKAIKSLEVGGPVLNTNQTVNVSYRTSPAGVYQVLGSTFNAGPLQRFDVPLATAGTQIGTFLTLNTTVSTASPIVNFFGIHYADRPKLWLTYEFNILAADYLARRDGRVSRTTAATIRDNLKNLVSGAAGVPATLPDETSPNLLFTGYEETVAWYERTRRWHAAIKVTAVDATGYSFPNAGSVGNLANYTVGGLTSFTVLQLNTL